jgi:predicted nucleotide-binding protein (sugar kinase/HSP70/actin superfamily)
LKVGIPRALIYYKFGEAFESFFKALGVEVVVSPHTNKKIKELAVSLAPNEDCYSTKLYFGHVMAIKDEVDYLFIPRFGGQDKRNVGCPKFIGLAEVLRSMFPDLPPIIMPHYNRAKGREGAIGFFLNQVNLNGDFKINLFFKAMKIGFLFTKNPFKIIRAFRKAVKKYKQKKKELIVSEEKLVKWENSEIYLNDPPKVNDGERPLKIALVGHSYVLNDPYSSLSLRKLLQEYGCDIVTSEQIPRNLIEKQMKKQYFQIYFDYEREILGTVMHYLEHKNIDGIIQLMVFSCGPDSVAGEMALQYSKRDPIVPLLQLVFDELTVETGLKTRIEAFVDMLRRRDKAEPVYVTAKAHI